MKRRNLLGGAGALALFGGITAYGYLEEQSSKSNEKTDSEFVDESEIPADIEPLVDLAYEFRDHIIQFYPNATVSLGEEAIATEIEVDASSAEGVKTELNRVAKEFATVFSETESDVPAPTFSVITHQVQAIVAPAVLDSYRAGDLTENAVIETIEITSVEQNEGDGNDHSSHSHE